MALTKMGLHLPSLAVFSWTKRLLLQLNSQYRHVRGICIGVSAFNVLSRLLFDSDGNLPHAMGRVLSTSRTGLDRDIL